MYCIYHSRDLDGWMSAAIVLKYAKENKFDKEVTFIGWDYGDPIPVLEKGRRVIMCDIMFPIEEMYKICDISSGSFVWIDHHASSIKQVLSNEGAAFCKAVIPKVRTIKLRKGPSLSVEAKGACELTWEYFYPKEVIPLVIEYLGCYDSFRHKDTAFEDDVVHFQYAARAYLTNYKECFDSLKFFDNFAGNYGRWINDGKVIKLYLNVEAKEAFKRAHDIYIDGYYFKTINQPRFNPNNFDIKYEETGAVGIASFFYKNGGWEISLYSNVIDVSKLASVRGGGGHFGAAGFRTKDISEYLIKE